MCLRLIRNIDTLTLYVTHVLKCSLNNPLELEFITFNKTAYKSSSVIYCRRKLSCKMTRRSSFSWCHIDMKNRSLFCALYVTMIIQYIRILFKYLHFENE